MHLGFSWYLVSGFAFLCATLSLLASGFVFASVVGKLSPLLQDTHDEILDLGDIAANTVGHVADTLDIIEQRVSATMVEAEAGGSSARGQVMGIGAALAGVYMASRIVGMLRGAVKKSGKRSKPFWRKLF